MKDIYKRFIRRHEVAVSFVYNFFRKNSTHIVGKDNLLKNKGVFRERTSLYIKGSNNRVVIDSGLTRLNNCSIYIWGNNNTIHIGSGSMLIDASLHIEDDGGHINIGESTIISGKTHIAVVEGKTVTIGERCLFSGNITLRTGDSHSILDKAGKRLNPSKDIFIGNHVWIGNTVIILKGTRVNDDSVIATGSLLTGKEYPSNSIIGGVGGIILKSEVNWCGDRIPVED